MTLYNIYWNGKKVSTVEGLETAKQTQRGMERDFGPLPKGTLTYRKMGDNEEAILNVELTQAQVNIIRYALESLPHLHLSENALSFSDKRIQRVVQSLLCVFLPPAQVLPAAEIVKLNEEVGL